MSWTAKISLILMGAALAACTEEKQPRGRGSNSVAEIEAWSTSFGPQYDVQTGVGKPADRKPGTVVMARENGPAWDWSDPCVENLHELTGLLLLHLQAHHELPVSLTELQSKALGGEERLLHCPETKKNYVYVREGLVPPLDIVPVPERPRGGDKLVLYDAVPTHEITQRLTDGVKDWDVKKKVRYGVVMKPKGNDGTVTLQVVPVEDDLLNAYLAETKRRKSNEQMIQQLPVQNLRPNTGGLW